MELNLVFPFLLAILLGFSLCANLAINQEVRSIALWVAPATGIGVTALLFYLWSIAFYPTFAPQVYIGLELLLAFFALSIFIYRLRRKGEKERVQPAFSPEKRLRWETALLGLVFAVCLGLFALSFVQHLRDSPYGEWDAWAVWNLRARYIFLGGAEWRNAFSEYLHGADYPVLISMAIARNWTLVGRDVQAVPQILAGIFAFSTVGLLISALSKARGRSQGLIAAIVLTSTPAFLYWSANQYADIPLGFYFLAAAAFIYIYNTSQSPAPQYLAVTGLMGGLALWTKNEGVFLVAGLLSAQAGYFVFKKRSLGNLREWIWFAIGILPALILLASFKLFVAPTNYVFNQSASSLLEKLLSWSRYKAVTLAFRDEFFSFGDWLVPLLPLLLFYAVFTGFDLGKIRQEKKALAILGITLAMIFLAYMAAYVITPLPMDWQIRQSIDRLVLQIFPSGLLLLFLMICNPLPESDQRVP